MGSEFSVTLPLVEADEPITGESDRQAGSRQRPRRILIVDDNVDAAETLSLLLQSYGCETQVIHDGIAALESAKCDPPDVMLLDIGLPGLDGYAVARQLRTLPSRGRMRIVAVTGYGGENDRQRSRDAGFDDHLTKPVTLEQLEELLSLG